MNIKIAGQSSKSNYHNTGSCAGAVIYNEHELRELPELFRELGMKPEDLGWFDMEGHVVSGAEVMQKIGRLTNHLGKDDAKFYCTMINPSDEEALAMGATVDEQITNGQPFVFDVMDAYAKNFHREQIRDRHDLVAFSIPHIYKSEDKQQIHWHVIQARLSRGFKVEIGDGKYRTKHYKLSPLTNHRNTSKGIVKGGFDRVAFDAECEKRFDIRYHYGRRVEQSFDYLLAEKKGSIEEKAVQETRLALQNLPELKESIQAAITRRVERLAREAAARAMEERRRLAEKLAGEPETFVIHGDSDATLFSNRPYSMKADMLHEAARSILKYYTWGANVHYNEPKEFVEDAVNGQQFGTVSFDMAKARFIGEDLSDGMLENPEEVIEFTDHTGQALDLITSEFRETWRMRLASLKNWIQTKLSMKERSQSVEKVPAPVQPQKQQAAPAPQPAAKPVPESTPVHSPAAAPAAQDPRPVTQVARQQAAPAPQPAAKPVPESTPVHSPAAAPAAQDPRPVTQVARQQAAPTPTSVAKPTILLEYKDSARTRFRIKKEEDGIMKLQQYGVSKQCPTKDGKPNMVWLHRAKFTSFDVLGQDNTYLYLKVKEDGDTKYINQYGNPLTRSQKKRFGISEIGGMNI